VVISDRAQLFMDFERRGWDEVASGYSRQSSQSTAKAAERLLDAAVVGPGLRVLDLASGPGWVAAAAKRRGAEVVGLDISTEMVTEAQLLHPDVEFRVGAAESIPFADGSFDVVVSAFGMPHFADHPAVFAEINRVLADGGRVAVTSWNPPDRNPFFAVAFGAIAAHGSLDVPLPDGVNMFSWADDAVCAELLGSCGFGPHTRSDVTIEIVTENGPDDVIDILENGSVRSRALFLAQTPEAQDAIRASLAELLEPFRSGDSWTITSSAFVLAADRT
jgi:SAM-dependent methyltransferase